MSVIYSPVLIRDNLYLPCIKNRYNDFSKRIFRRKGKITGNTTTAGKSTIGVFEEGEYTFGTSTHETMIVIEGELMAQIPVETVWKSFKAGTSFEVAAYLARARFNGVAF